MTAVYSIAHAEPVAHVYRGIVAGSTVSVTFPEARELPGRDLVATFNAVTGARVSRFASRAAGLRRLEAALEAAAVDPPKERKMTDVTTTTQHRGRTPRFADDLVVELLAKENPKRAGKKNHERFAGMMSAMDLTAERPTCTVGAAVAAGATYGDLEWDHAHGYIVVHGAEARGSAQTTGSTEVAE